MGFSHILEIERRRGKQTRLRSRLDGTEPDASLRFLEIGQSQSRSSVRPAQNQKPQAFGPALSGFMAQNGRKGVRNSRVAGKVRSFHFLEDGAKVARRILIPKILVRPQVFQPKDQRMCGAVGG